jgi:hypothetical protein
MVSLATFFLGLPKQSKYGNIGIIFLKRFFRKIQLKEFLPNN